MLAFLLSGSLAADEFLFIDDLQKAIKNAKESGRPIILFTGRSVFCEPKTPQQCFLQVVLPRYPELKKLAAKSILVDGFIYTPMNDARGKMTEAFKKDFREWTPMADKYGLIYFYPTITFLSPGGEKDRGPFVYYGGDFSMTGDKDKLNLREYLEKQAEQGGDGDAEEAP